jgi:hypothetical protein
MLKRGVAERDAVRSLLLMVMEDLTVREVMNHGADLTYGSELEQNSLGQLWATLVTVIASVVALGTSVGFSVASMVRSRREEREAEARLRDAPLSPGEMQQIALQLVQHHRGYTSAARTEALDIVKLMRPGRSNFVEGEERQLSQMVNDYIRQEAEARAAAQQAAQQQQLLTLGGLAALAIAGVAVVKFVL